METKNPPPMMTEKIPTTKPPTRSSAVSHVSSQGASALIHERSITLLHLDASDGMHRLPLHRRMTIIAFSATTVYPQTPLHERQCMLGAAVKDSRCFPGGLRLELSFRIYVA